MKQISVIIPVYKQEKTIKQNLIEILDSLSNANIDFEIIVVIDGFLDKSLEQAKKIKDKRIKVIGYKTNHGKGYAVRYGFAKAKYDIISFIDSGGDLNIEIFPLMLDQFLWQNADIVIGSKRHPDSKVNYPFSRRILSWGYQKIVRILFNLNVRDTQVGMKIFKRKVLENVLPRLLVKKFAFDIELLAVANYLKYSKIYESPIELYFRYNSTITSINFWKVIWNMLIDTMAIFYRLRIIKYYDESNKRIWKFDPELNFRVNIG
jgi:glycosyltransferase involved in cell wall biosynthesis